MACIDDDAQDQSWTRRSSVGTLRATRLSTRPSCRCTLETSMIRKNRVLHDATVGTGSQLFVACETGSFSAQVARKILASPFFQMFDNGAIVASVLCIGLEQTRRINGQDTAWVYALEHCFIFIFIAELAMKFLRGRSRAFSDSWFVFDLVVVSIAALSDWTQLIVVSYVDDHNRSYVNLRIILVARVARLARLARAMRLVQGFQQLWMLVSAFLNSVKTIAWVLMLLLIMLYVFSTVAVELITLRYKGNEDVPEQVQEITAKFFPSLGMTMLTLLQFVCLDSIGAIYRPMIEYDWPLVIFFGAAILIIAVFLMNIIAAVIVTKAMEQMSEDKELKQLQKSQEKDRQMRTLRRMFERLDVDGSGCIDLFEIERIAGEDADLLSTFAGDMDPREIFGMLDIDGEGVLSIDDFCDGLYEVAVSAVPVGLKRMERQMDRITDISEMIKELHAEMFGSKVKLGAFSASGAGALGSRSRSPSGASRGSQVQAGLRRTTAVVPGELPEKCPGVDTPSAALAGGFTATTPRQTSLRASARCLPSEVSPKHSSPLEPSIPDAWAGQELQWVRELIRRTRISLSELEKVWIPANLDSAQDAISAGKLNTAASFLGSVCAAPPPVPFGHQLMPQVACPGLAAEAAAAAIKASQVDKEVPLLPVHALSVAFPKRPGPGARAATTAPAHRHPPEGHPPPLGTALGSATTPALRACTFVERAPSL